MAHSIIPGPSSTGQVSQMDPHHQPNNDTYNLDILASVCVLLQNGIEPKDMSDLEILGSISRKPIGVQLRDKLRELDIERSSVIKVPEARVLDKWFQDFNTILGTSKSLHNEDPTTTMDSAASRDAFIYLVDAIREHYRQKLNDDDQINQYYSELRDKFCGSMHEECRRQRDESSLLTPDQRLKDMAIDLESCRKKLRDAERLIIELKYELDTKRQAFSRMGMNGVEEYPVIRSESKSDNYTQDGGFNNDGLSATHDLQEDEDFCAECYENGRQQGEGSGSYDTDEEDGDDCDTEMEDDGSEEYEQNYHYSQLSSNNEYGPKTLYGEVSRPIKGSKQAERSRMTQVSSITTC